MASRVSPRAHAAHRPRSAFIPVGLLLAAVLLVASCAGDKPARSAFAGSTSSTPLDPLTPLTAPKSSTVEDTEYLADVAQADGALASYIQTQGNVALQALLTDGSAFCAFLQRDADIDDAMASVADGARGVESQTRLPMTVATFNTIDAVALLTLCPSEQKLLPAAEQAKISQLGRELTSQPG
jgi:hypothetical protein